MMPCGSAVGGKFRPQPQEQQQQAAGSCSSETARALIEATYRYIYVTSNNRLNSHCWGFFLLAATDDQRSQRAFLPACAYSSTIVSRQADQPLHDM